MRKNATKLAAAVLSLAMVMTSVNMPASAAKTKVKLNKTKATLYVNGSKSEKSTTLKVTVNGKKVNATFKSSNTKVLTVAKKTGKVTAKKNGTAKVTATYKKKKYNCTVTVKTYATSVSITSAKTLNLAAGKTATIKATVKPSTASNKKVSFASSNKNVATVTSAGKVTAKKAGTATVTVKALGSKKAAKKATVKVNVKAAVKPSTEPTTTPTTEPTATPETPVATEGAITVTTNVSGASIKVVTGTSIVASGTAVGTSYKTDKLPNGTYTVVASKAGYDDATATVIVNGEATSPVDIKLVEKAVKVTAISAITFNTATVVLDEAPARELKPSDFNVAGNTVTNIKEGNFNTVYTLTLGTSLDDKKGTLSINGATKDYDFSQLRIKSVSAKNLRQLTVTFNKDLALPASLDSASGTYLVPDMLDNLHIWMTKEEEGTTATKSIKSIVGANSSDWVAYVQPTDKKTVIIESKDGSKLTDAAATGLALKLNETYEVEALNVKDAAGKYSDVSYVTNLLQDNVRPSVKDWDKSVVKSQTAKLNINFTEPMSELKNSKAKVYLDGKDVTSAITDVDKTTTVAAHSKISVDVSSLDKGAHTFAIVGAEDLNGNVLSDNTKEYTFNITDPADPAESATPVVTDIQQIADNAFKVVFNTSKVNLATAPTAGKITIKNGAYDADANGGKGEYKDMDLDATNMKVNEVPATATVKEHTEWICAVDATKDTDATKLSYKGANVMSKDIVISGFEVTGGKAGKDVTKSLTFKKDITAPVVHNTTSSTDTIHISFNDAPFADAAEIELAKTTKVTVKYVNDKGVTYSEDITPTLNADKKSIDIKVTNEDMLNAKKNGLIPGGKYSIVLPDAVIKDTEEAVPTGITAATKYVILDGLHPLVGTTVNYTVPGVNTVAGSVPQTTRGMIFTGYEVKNSIGTLATAVYNGGSPKLTLKDNQIVVVFEGDVDAATANNKDNYTLNGKVLPTGTTVEYREADITGSTDKEKFALITLPDNTVSLTGGQDFTVQNVANKEGYKMMPVADVITLADNTAPTIKSIEVNASNKITLTFSEEVDLKTTDMTQLERNFVITANGKTVSLSDAVVNGKKMTITTADNFADSSLNVPVSVKIKKDSDGNIFVEDKAGNKAAEMTATK